MSAQLLHQMNNGGQDFFGTALLEILLQDSFLQKIPDMPPLVEEEVQHIAWMDLYMRTIQKNRVIPP